MKSSILTILACSFTISPAGAARTLSGVVKGADGTIIMVGAVTASRQAGGAVTRLERTSASAAIRPDGSFTLPPLALWRVPDLRPLARNRMAEFLRMGWQRDHRLSHANPSLRPGFHRAYERRFGHSAGERRGATACGARRKDAGGPPADRRRRGFTEFQSSGRRIARCRGKKLSGPHTV